MYLQKAPLFLLGESQSESTLDIYLLFLAVCGSDYGWQHAKNLEH